MRLARARDTHGENERVGLHLKQIFDLSVTRSLIDVVLCGKIVEHMRKGELEILAVTPMLLGCWMVDDVVLVENCQTRWTGIDFGLLLLAYTQVHLVRDSKTD